MLGAGTQANPYIIQTPQDLDDVRNNMTEGIYYELGNDIDMSSFGNFTTIGKNVTGNYRFECQIDGKGYKIKNLTINESSNYTGLFGLTMANSVIKNLGVENCIISSTVDQAGALVARAYGLIENCYSTGQVTGRNYVGGLVGYSYSGVIKNSFSSCDVNGDNFIGGIIGDNHDNSTIENCYSTGLVNCNDTYGGLVGYNVGTVTNSYWDTETSGTTVSAGGEGKTTTEMKQQSTYTNWDFTDTWGIDGDYPYLQVFGSPQVIKIETREVNSYTNLIQSKLSTTKRKNIFTNSHIDKITSSVSRSKRFLKLADSFIYPIESNVTKTTRSVKTANYNVVGYISPITSSVQRKVKTYKDIKSYINSIQSTINVKYPRKIINAYSQILENKSNSVIIENRSTSNKIENPSMLEVV